MFSCCLLPSNPLTAFSLSFFPLQVYEVFSFKIKSGESAIPRNWILEKSVDGVAYKPWQYFAVSEAECSSRYNLSNQYNGNNNNDDDDVKCNTEFAQLSRLKYGEAKVLLQKNRRNHSLLYPEGIDYTLARYIRIRLQGM